MTENLTPSTLPVGKFTYARDEYLHRLTLDNGAEEFSGETDAPTGYFARFHITAEGADYLARTDAENTHADAVTMATLGTNPAEITGDFILTETSTGAVSVTAYDTTAEAVAAYEALEDEYAVWNDQDDDDTEAERPTIRDYCDRAGISVASVEYLGVRDEMNGDAWQHHAYKVRLENESTGRKWTVAWHEGMAHGGRPDADAAEILDALISDATSYLDAGDFETWAGEFVPDLDTLEYAEVRRYRTTYNACGRVAERLATFLGDDEIETVANDYDRL
ncbi:hypothetical protein Mbo2_098 [Rhodococcus phage Mbo2]|uniref:Uncharacterized protein n=1 Tax=Rhodococcus phage Mbo2 TaxID=2936911 RepID=A0A9E7LH87_9CAUD|nr:hypothetical protein Mbo2_098 [Rhodococcus phage Mbo2]